MTRNEFVEKHRHELCGLIVDAAVHCRRDIELSLWLRTAMVEIDKRLAAIFDDAAKVASENKQPDKPTLPMKQAR